jgi:hypothetical protein
MLQKNTSPPSSESKSKSSTKLAEAGMIEQLVNSHTDVHVPALPPASAGFLLGYTLLPSK